MAITAFTLQDGRGGILSDHSLKGPTECLENLDAKTFNPLRFHLDKTSLVFLIMAGLFGGNGEENGEAKSIEPEDGLTVQAIPGRFLQSSQHHGLKEGKY